MPSNAKSPRPEEPIYVGLIFVPGLNTVPLSDADYYAVRATCFTSAPTVANTPDL